MSVCGLEQAHWRGWCQRRLARRHRVDVRKTAVMIQCAWRSLLARRYLRLLQAAHERDQHKKAIRVQAYMRMKVAREEFLFKRTANVILQCFYRKHFVARRLWDAAVAHRKTVLGERDSVGTSDTPTMIGSVVIRRSQVRRYLRLG